MASTSEGVWGKYLNMGMGFMGKMGWMGWMGPRIIMRGTERKGNREERSEASKARPGGSKQAGRGEQGEAGRQQAGGAGRGKRGQAERGLYFSQYFW